MPQQKKQRPGWAAGVIRFRVVILVAAGALAAVSLYHASHVKFDSSVEGWFLEGDPNITEYNKFLDRFAGDEISVVGVFAPDVFEPKVMQAIDRLTHAAGGVPYAHRVQSLTNIKIFDNQGEALQIRRLVRRLPSSAAESRALRRQALENPLLVGTILDSQAQVTAIVVELTGGPDNMGRKVAQARALEQLIEQENRRAAAGKTQQHERSGTGRSVGRQLYRLAAAESTSRRQREPADGQPSSRAEPVPSGGYRPRGPPRCILSSRAF